MVDTDDMNHKFTKISFVHTMWIWFLHCIPMNRMSRPTQTKWAIWTKQWRLLLKQIQFQILRLLHLFNFISLAQHILQHWILHFWNAIFLQYQHCSPIYILWKIVSIETLASPMKQLKCKYVTRMWLYAQRTSTMEKYKWRTLQWQIRNTTFYSRL